MAKKSNVFLSSAYNMYGLSGCKQCGFMETNDLNEYWKELQNMEIPASSCVRSLSTDLHRSDRISRIEPYKEITAERLVVSIWPTNKKCSIKEYKNCTKCIAAGKCRDEFVINAIGKKLFADKYQETK